MKVVVTSRGEGVDAEVDPRFGRAAVFVLVDTETGAATSIDNSEGVAAAQGAGIRAAETLSRLGVDCLLTGHCGPKAFRSLETARIAVYTGAVGTVADALAALQAGALERSSVPDVGGHRG